MADEHKYWKVKIKSQYFGDTEKLLNHTEVVDEIEELEQQWSTEAIESYELFYVSDQNIDIPVTPSRVYKMLLALGVSTNIGGA